MTEGAPVPAGAVNAQLRRLTETVRRRELTEACDRLEATGAPVEPDDRNVLAQFSRSLVEELLADVFLALDATDRGGDQAPVEREAIASLFGLSEEENEPVDPARIVAAAAKPQASRPPPE